MSRPFDSSSTLREVTTEARRRLAAAGVDSPGLSARMLISHATGLTDVQLISESLRRMTFEEKKRIDALIQRREQGEPVAYITGSKEFYGLEFKVTPDTLIPRPETELIIDLVRARFDAGSDLVFSDWGTGSGILAGVLLQYFPRSIGIAVDLSAGALAAARSNISTLASEDRFLTVRGDFTRPLIVPGSLDVLVSNPPYVTCSELEAASPEVRRFEPITALVGGLDGGDHIRAAAPRARRALKPGGVMFMEIGCGQAELVRKTLSESDAPFENIVVHQDLAGLDRVVEAW